MTKNSTHKVIQVFDEKIDYPYHITKQYKKILSSLKQGETFDAIRFQDNYVKKFTKADDIRGIRNITSNCFRIGKKIGVLELVNDDRIPLPFREFLQLESVDYWQSQLRKSKTKNVKDRYFERSGTQDQYGRRLWSFNNWLYGKTFSFNRTRQIDDDTFKRISEKITLTGVEQFLELLQQPNSVDSDFIKIIKKYLHNEIHSKKSATTMGCEYSAIKSYFEKNDIPLVFKFDPKARYKTNSDQEDVELSLEDFMKILTVGQPSLTEKAVFLCKFHRGLDTITLVDRFNFEAWEQLVKYFGTQIHQQWDLSLCPVPIKLVRIKTDVKHTGFLDRDAVIAIQDYLDYRFKKTDKTLENDQPMFLNQHGRTISSQWIAQKFKKLARRAGVLHLIDSDSNKYNMVSHELRDLLKSTLIDSGTRMDIADHVIGHKAKDSYEKQTTLYPESLRSEYMKASTRINIFSNISHYMKGTEDVESLRQQLTELKTNQSKLAVELQRLEEIRRIEESD